MRARDGGARGDRGGGVGDDQGAVGSASEGGSFQGGRTSTCRAGDGDRCALARGESAHQFIRLGVGRATEAESASVDVLTGGIRPTALAIGHGTNLIDDRDRAAWAHHDGVVIGV